MRYEIAGPFQLEMQENGLPNTSISAKNKFWEKATQEYDGIADACGCYVFTIAAKHGGELPWYVGLTKKRGFRGECFGKHQTSIYQEATAGKKYAQAQFYFIIKLTNNNGLAKPTKNKSGHKDIVFLENYIIALALGRNSKLLNSRQTKYLKEMIVPGIINSKKSRPDKSTSGLKKALAM